MVECSSVRNIGRMLGLAIPGRPVYVFGIMPNIVVAAMAVIHADDPKVAALRDIPNFVVIAVSIAKDSSRNTSCSRVSTESSWRRPCQQLIGHAWGQL